jgi:predicted nucleic acid-binding protein
MAEPAAAYGGRVFIADASAWQRASHPAVRAEWARALRRQQIATCPIVKLDLLYSAASGRDYDRLDRFLGALRDIPITRSVTNAALSAQRRLAQRRPPAHRGIKRPDLLIAAAAEDGAVGVLHYDHDFDRMAEVLSFESRWVAEPGSL